MAFDWLPFGSDEGGASDLDDAQRDYVQAHSDGPTDGTPTDNTEQNDVEEELAKERQRRKEAEEAVQEAREEMNKDDSQRSRRLAELEEKAAQETQERKKREQRIEQLQERVQEVQENQDREVGGVAGSIPDTDAMQGKPVISTYGGQNFGRFRRFVNRGGKFAVECEHPREGVIPVGWADSLRDLVIDVENSAHKDVIIVKRDEQFKPTDIPNVAQFRDEIQRRKEQEERASRLNGENNRLKDQNRKLKQLNEQLMSMVSAAKMNGFNAEHDKDQRIAELQGLRDLDKEDKEIMGLQKRARDSRQERTVEEYEKAKERTISKVGTPEREQAYEMVQGDTDKAMELISQLLSRLPEEAREEAMMQAGGSGSPTVTMQTGGDGE